MKTYLCARLSWMKSFLVEDILSRYDVPDTKRDKQGLKSLVLERRNLHVWKTSHVLGIINKNAQLSKKTRHRPENEISIDDAHLDTLYTSIQIFEARLISKRRSQRYFTRLKYFSSFKQAQIYHFAFEFALSIVG